MYTAAVITVSDKGFAGEREDTGGPLVKEMLENAGYSVIHTEIHPRRDGHDRKGANKCRGQS